MTIDKRIVKVGIEIRGKLKTYDGLAVVAHGTKFANANQNTCDIAIANLDQDTQNYLLTECSPFNKNNTPKTMTLDVGRESTGTFRLFEGQFAYCSLGQKSQMKEEKSKGGKGAILGEQKKQSEPADTGDVSVAGDSGQMDIWVNFRALTLDDKKGKILTRTGLPQQSFRELSQGVADDLGIPLDFNATDKLIGNYSFSGAALKQVDKLSEAGAVSAYVDDGKLIVKDINLPLPSFKRVLNLDSGMIGKPEFTEQGCKVKFLIDPQTKLGGALEVVSKTIPAVNGTYIIYKLTFEVSSRDIPFYYMAEAVRYEV